MRGYYKSDQRIMNPGDCVGLTVARVKMMENWLLQVFADGRFLLAQGVNSYGDTDIGYERCIPMHEARYLGLVTDEEYAAWRHADDAERAAEAERQARKEYERLRAKFGG